ncbi:hypothetical protein P875_00138163 [Aspergillus parasiticus SU-1]|uniref:Uncharacterized protein n=1 Tax=Aspergillus parasiticus (strain ATCC 56775 / NRRL 5862 / SRRC 143 / SU-1) TaxID=1403190 RepID=A0A0F0I9N0_ASPPU|nr:hypothetical protein P875_00138163 [Aspergillus parasiticus SU-1]
MDGNSISTTKGYDGQNHSSADIVPATTSSRDSNQDKCPAQSALKRLERHAAGIYEEVDSVSQSISQQTYRIEQMEQQLENAHQRIQKLEVELQTQIFRSIPDYQVSDASISEDFLVIRDSLCEWMEGIPDIKSFTETLDDAIHRRGIDESMFTFPRELQLEYDHAQTEILTMISFGIIREHVLESLVFAAPPADLELLERLYNMMSMLEPKKDIESINLWRSDTVRAYATTQVYKDKIVQHCSGLADYLRGFFGCFSFEETFDWDQKFRRLEEQILPQIAALALKLNCSPERYCWEWYPDTNWTQPIVFCKRDLSHFITMDAHTHHTLNPQTARFANMQDDAPVGVVLLILYPALFRLVPGSQNDILIQKAVVVIQGYESLPSNLKAKVDSLVTKE